MVANKYFNDNLKTQTKIKHFIFKNCLETSLSIANKNTLLHKNDRKYIFIDCYAGAGMIQKHSGSPIIACKIFIKEIERLDKLKIFELIFFEKNQDIFTKLIKNIEPYTNIIPIKCINDSWVNNINTYLKQYVSDYGFIFIDPFANESIDLNLLEMIIKNNYLKDILIFLNIQALRRLTGKDIPNTLNITKKDIQSNQIEYEILKKFKKLKKEFVLFASFPTERQQNMINSDYFGLIYLTNSANVADKFLESYKEIIENFKKTENYLFGNRDLKQEILEILKNQQEIILLELIKTLQNKYLSWKKTLKIEEIPTLKRIIKCINELLIENKIKIISPFLHKKTKNKLTLRAIKTNQNLKQTIIKNF
jgi:three-Cys-motif partner protein